jgi:hypothetical protein
MTNTFRRLLEVGRIALRRRDVLAFAGGLGLESAIAADQEGGAAPGAEIWVSFFRDKTVWAYINRHSVEPGEHFDLMMSTRAGRGETFGHVEFFRVEPSSVEGGQKLVWRSDGVVVPSQSVLRTASTIGAHWVPILISVDTSSWPPGYYSCDFIEEKSNIRDLQIAQLIVRNPARSGKMLLKLCTNTYQAYNSWGGHSLYPSESDNRGAMVSFDRPTGPAFFEYDVYLVQWLEELGLREGFSVDYVSNFDVHRDADLLKGYPLVACGGHDEYWSKEEFDAFEHRIFVRGQNTIFFGANTAYFQVRYTDIDRPPGGEDWGRQIVCYKTTGDPITRRRGTIDPALLMATRFREQGRRPETMLAGVAYQDWFSPDDPGIPYFVTTTDAPFFAGTGYQVGDAAADVVGYEWDNRDPLQDRSRLWEQDQSRIAPIPLESIKVLFNGTASGERTKNGRAEAVYFESAAGARVFSTGSIRWCWGIGKPGVARAPFRRFNENLVMALMR